MKPRHTRREFLIGVAAAGSVIVCRADEKIYSSKYRDLGRLPLLDRNDLMNAAPPEHWADLEKAMSLLEEGDARRAVGLTAQLIKHEDEPAAEYILGRALYRVRMISAAEEALLKAERMTPSSPYRCWSALQVALILGNVDVVRQEGQHLADNPQYGEQVRKILDEVKKRG